MSRGGAPPDGPGPLSCPVPVEGDVIELAHGGGGRAMHRLLREHVGAALGAEALRHDGAVLPAEALAGGDLVLTTDSSVVRPLVFPGGDLGVLAVCGTVNDLAVTGAVPLALSLALVLEEGLPLSTLDRLLASVRATADACGISVVTGDTKVVERGRGDGVYATTTGVGRRLPGVELDARRVAPGDVLVLSGDVGRHAVAVLSARAGLGFSGDVCSDVAPIHAPVGALLERLPGTPFLRDCTRGGLAAVVHELARAGDLVVEIDEAAVPLSDGVRGASEILGLDPLQLACEGRFLAVVREDDVETALAALAAHEVSAGARVIGRVTGTAPGGAAWLRGLLGQERPLQLGRGELLPRIC